MALLTINKNVTGTWALLFNTAPTSNEEWDVSNAGGTVIFAFGTSNNETFPDGLKGNPLPPGETGRIDLRIGQYVYARTKSGRGTSTLAMVKRG